MEYCSKCMNPIDGTQAECPFCGYRLDTEIPAHHLTPGTLLNNRFMVGAALGEGGFGITYIGMDTKLDMKVAIKEYYPNGYVNRSNTVSPAVNSSTSEERKDFFDSGRERFMREAKILAKFAGSTGIVDVRDFFEENNTAYIVMEYLDGKTLKDYLKTNGKLTDEQTISLLMPVMESLKKIHTQGLIHRDISPDNIMLVDGRVKLLDFGAARNVSATANNSLSVMLKPGYAPEEQYRSKGEQGPWTDVYALCATMYKCITGVTPDDAAQRLYNDELKAPSALGIAIDPAIEKALLKGLNVKQKDRYQSIDELLDGFKGNSTVEDDDSRTVYYAEPSFSEDDKPTEFISPELEEKTALENRDVTVFKAKKAPEKRAKKEAPAPNVPTKAASDDVSKKTKKHKKKTAGAFLLPAALVIVAVVAAFTVFKLLSTTTVAGETVDRNEEWLFIYKETITEADMKAIKSLRKLEMLTFTNCVFDKSTSSYLGDISAPLDCLSFEGCTGFDDYSVISELAYLRTLEISGCNLTDEQLNSISFDQLEYLENVTLSDNAELSDLTPLSRVKLLCRLTVDNTAVRDFSAVKDCAKLEVVSAQNCGITDISTLTNSAIKILTLNDNEISDISNMAYFERLSRLYLNNNMIEDISPLVDATPYLTILEIDGNQITSLESVSAFERLRELSVNRNRLTDLDGLEDCLQLEELEAAENQITNIDGITNCTVLEKFNINKNSVSDISLLGKSAATLKAVYFNNNNVSDISCLENAENLKYLSFDYNGVTTLDPLINSTQLRVISAEYNEIESIAGLENSTALEYIFLPHNKINDMTPLASLMPREENDRSVIDLSSNSITELKLATDKEYTYLAVYNNPITSFSAVSEASGISLFFTYAEGTEFTGFDGAFKNYYITDCPKDMRLGIKDAIPSAYVSFGTAEEVDAQVRNIRAEAMEGFA